MAPNHGCLLSFLPSYSLSPHGFPQGSVLNALSPFLSDVSLWGSTLLGHEWICEGDDEARKRDLPPQPQSNFQMTAVPANNCLTTISRRPWARSNQINFYQFPDPHRINAYQSKLLQLGVICYMAVDNSYISLIFFSKDSQCLLSPEETTPFSFPTLKYSNWWSICHWTCLWSSLIASVMEHVPPLAEFFLVFGQQACTGLPLTRGKAMPVGWGTEMKKHILYHSLSEGADTTFSW